MQPPSHATLTKHLFFLAGQAIVLLVLAVLTTSTNQQLDTKLAKANSQTSLAKKLALENQIALSRKNGSTINSDAKAVLGEQTDQLTNTADGSSPENASGENPSAETAQQAAAARTRAFPHPPKGEYKIAIFGDSMVDTMGEALEYLDRELSLRYPSTIFQLYNYGVGSQNVLEATQRVYKPFKYQDRDYPPIDQIKPDIIIVGSFAYNVMVPYDRDAHWLGYTQLVQQMQKIAPNVYMLAEIAPMRKGFGFGPNGVNWEPRTAVQHTGKIVDQLENVLGLSKALNVPLIDAYTPSLEPDRKEGQRQFVNPSDNIHPSVEGHIFIAQQIANTIVLK